MLSFTDQMNRSIQLSSNPKRIVSLVPSQTELLYHLELETEVVGITKFCVHPGKWYRNKTRVGGTKTLNINSIASLKPDLIIANKEENVPEQVEGLASIAPVWVSNIQSIEDAFQMIQCIGNLTGKEPKANELITNIQKEFKVTSALAAQKRSDKIRTAYLIWKDPYMAVGSETFIHSMMTLCGLENVMPPQSRYPETDLPFLEKNKIELVLLSSEPYPFSQKHLTAIQSALPKARIMLVDGEMFSWYGSRMLLAGPYFQQLIQQING